VLHLQVPVISLPQFNGHSMTEPIAEPFDAVLGSGAGGPLSAPTPWIQYSGYLNYGGGIVVGAPTGGNQGNGTVNAQSFYINGTLVNLNNYLLLAGGTLTGPLILAADPTTALGAVTKQYSDTKVPLVGGTMTGPLILNANPAVALGAAPKQYVDSSVANYVPLAGGTMTGLLVLSANPAVALGAATKQYVDSAVTTINGTFANYLPLAGGTMTGFITLSADPTANLQAATKQYVDNKTAGYIGIPDAPSDGSTYGRNNAAWTNVLDAGTF
jgi:hypothetical protein